MIAYLRQTGLLWSTAMSIVGFCVLIALGNWQWQRMHWKQGLIRDLEAATSAAPVALEDMPGRDRKLIYAGAAAADLQSLQFRRLKVSGLLQHNMEMHVWSPKPNGPAWSVVTPMKLQIPAGNGAEQITHILVIRGTVPAAQKDAAVRSSGEPSGWQSVVGRIRLDQPNDWANQPDIKKNEWFTRDLAAMARFVQSSTQDSIRIAPFFLEAEQALAPSPAPQPDLKALQLSNRHLEYALTWWGLAATLLCVFGAFAFGRLKGRKSGAPPRSG